MSVALYSCYGMNIMHHFFNLQVAICVDPLIWVLSILLKSKIPPTVCPFHVLANARMFTSSPMWMDIK